jgi:hypothetical protein
MSSLFKIAGLLFLAGITGAECRKDHSDGTANKNYSGRITILHNRISSLLIYEGATLLRKSEYTFTDTSVTLVTTNANGDTTRRVSYKLGENGYAESSKAYPEEFRVTARDTFFLSRVFYKYDAQGHLTQEFIGDLRNDTLRHEYTYIGDTMLVPNIEYYYEGDELTRKVPRQPYSVSAPACYDYEYGPSDKICRLDYSTNGILGKSGRYLVDYCLAGESCSCSPAMTTRQYYYTYVLNSDDYVIRVKQVIESCHNPDYRETTVTNYEITYQ